MSAMNAHIPSCNNLVACTLSGAAGSLEEFGLIHAVVNCRTRVLDVGCKVCRNEHRECARLSLNLALVCAVHVPAWLLPIPDRRRCPGCSLRSHFPRTVRAARRSINFERCVPGGMLEHTWQHFRKFAPNVRTRIADLVPCEYLAYMACAIIHSSGFSSSRVVLLPLYI